MTTANDGYNGGAGGKFRKKKVLRKTTPYDRPSIAIRNPNPNNTSKSGFLSRLIYAGADRLLGAFWKRNPALTAAPVTGTNEEQRNEHQEEGPNFGLKTNTGAVEPNTNEGGNVANISAATEISDLETMLKQKTFTRYEIERLTALLHSRTTTSDVGEGDQANISNDSHVEERENFHAVISTPVVNSRAFEEDVASPAELAKAYMGASARPAKVSPSTLRHGSQAPRQDSVLLNNTTILPRTPVTSPAPRTAGSLKGVENGMTTPRSRGRSAIYSMARSPYYRGPSTLSKKPTPSLISSQLAWELEGSNGNKMAGKHRSSVLDDLGSGGPMRRIRQKANLYSQGSSLSKHKSELDSSAQRLLVSSEPEQKASKAIVENGETSKRNSGYASVPTESTQMASKIFEHLERMSPKEKPSSSRLAGTIEKSATKLTSNLALGSLDKVESSKFLLSIEENGPKRFAVPLNVLSSMNGNSTAPVQGNAPTTNGDSTLAVPAEPPQKKRAFQTSALEDSQVLDDDNHSNGHVSVSLGENTKPGTSLLVNNNVSAAAPAEVFQTPAATPNIVSPPKTDPGSPGGFVVNKQKVGNNLQTSPPSSSTSTGISQSTNSPTAASTVLPSSTPAPVFKLASATASLTPAIVSPSVTEAPDTSATKDKEPKSNIFSSSTFSSTSISSPSATLTTNGQVFGLPTNTQAPTTVAQAVPYKFGSPSTAIPSSTAVSSLFSSYAHSFGPSSAAASSEIKSGSSTSGFTTSNFGSPPFSFGAPSTSTPSTTSSPAVFNVGASTASSVFSFNAASATNLFSQAPFGTPTASFNNNDQMSMEDSMHEESIQTPSPAIPAFAPASAGKQLFASGTQTPSPSTVPFLFGVQTNQPPSRNPFQVQTNQPPSQNAFQVQTNQPPSQNPFQVQTNQLPSQNPFQVQTNQSPSQNPFQVQTNQPPSQNPFQVQTNQPPSQNPFQASGSLELHAGGSFSLGSGGGDKSTRRFLKASKSKNRKK
nr:hypothetical protein [Tanacetum cinerariifolium]